MLIKRFIDRVSQVDGRRGTSVVLPIEEARGLRDELSKLLLDNYELLSNKPVVEQAIKIEVTGGTF